MSGVVSVLHLRSAGESGGGPDKTIIQTARSIDTSRVDYRVIYLKKQNRDISGLTGPARQAGLDFLESPGRRIFDPVQFFKLVSFIRREKIEILHAHDPKSDILCLMLGLFSRKAIRITTLHGWVVRPQRRLSSIYGQLDKRAMRFFDAVIAVSSDIAGIAAGMGAKKVLLLHNAVDINWWRRDMTLEPQAEWENKVFTVGFVGRLSREKGPDLFLEAAGRLVSADASIRFAVAGSGPLAAVLKEKAESAELAGKVKFHGQLDAFNLKGFYHGIDCLLSPSQTEGLPNNLLEALALEVPVVATDVGGVSDLVVHGKNGLLCPAGNIADISNAVLQIKNNPILARNLAAAGRIIVEERFSFAERTEKLTAFYEELVCTRRKS